MGAIEENDDVPNPRLQFRVHSILRVSPRPSSPPPTKPSRPPKRRRASHPNDTPAAAKRFSTPTTKAPARVSSPRSEASSRSSVSPPASPPVEAPPDESSPSSPFATFVPRPLSQVDSTGSFATGEVTFEVLREGRRRDISFCVIKLPEDNRVALGGATYLSVLRGTVRIGGVDVDGSFGCVSVISAPVAPFVMTISAVQRSSEGESGKRSVMNHIKREYCERHEEIKAQLQKNWDDDSVVLLLSELEGDVMTSVLPLLPRWGIKGGDTGRPLHSGARALDEANLGSLRLFQEWQGWDAVSQSIVTDMRADRQIRVLLLGARGSGKSTLLRSLLALLSREGSVLLDTDIGQPENNPAGIVASYLIRHAKLGAALPVHVWQPMAARFIGETTPRDDMEHYQEAVESVVTRSMRTCAERNLPMIINTVGWLSGMGAELMRGLVQIAKITHVIWVNNGTETAGLVDEIRGHDVKWLQVESTGGGAKIDRHIRRELQMAAYILPPLKRGVVHRSNVQKLNVRTTDGYELRGMDALMALNASVVALQRGREMVGMAIVRGVQYDGSVYVSTPVDMGATQVDTMVVSGNVTLGSVIVKSLQEGPYLLTACLSGGGMHQRTLARAKNGKQFRVEV